MYKSTQELLLEALHQDDLTTFSFILEKHGWPVDPEFSGYYLLRNAIKLKRKPFVTYLLDRGCGVYVKPGILTPLHLAVVNEGWYDIVELLISLKCPIDEKHTQDKGNTAVHVAHINDVSGEIIDLLLRSYLRNKSSAYCENVTNDDGLSFLHIASSRPSVEVVKQFVKADLRGVNLSEEQSFFTPLHFAVLYRRYAVAEYLLRCNASVYKQNCTKSTPLHLALKLRDFKMINLILDHDERKENVVDELGLSHFMAACAVNNEIVVRDYLKLAESTSNELINAMVRGIDSQVNYTPLHYAVDFGLTTRTVKLLLDYGADCCATAINGKTPHTIAKEKGHDLMCDMLNEHCRVYKVCLDTVASFLSFEKRPTAEVPVAPSSRDQNRNLSILPPPSKKIKRTKSLVPILPKKVGSRGAVTVPELSTFVAENPPSSPPTREYPVDKQLLRALEKNDVNQFLTTLQTKGCPKSAGFTILKTAIKMDRKREVLALLDTDISVLKQTQANSCAKTPLHLAATKVGWTDVVERLLEKGCRAEDKDTKGVTPLELAFLAGASVNNTIDVLLKSYVDNFDKDDRKGQVGFLHIACTRQSLEVVRRLVESNLEYYQLDFKYSASYATPLHFAVTHKRHEIAFYLIQRGANLYLQNSNGLTPLHLALQLRDVLMIDLILKCDVVKRDVVDRFGMSHFMAACASSNIKFVQEYLWVAEARFNLSPYDLIFAQAKIYANYAASGYTPLHFASHFGRIETVELLLAYGADCCLVAGNGFNCHTLAKSQGHKQIYRILKEHCEVIRRCKEMRAQSPDFGMWGEKYEWDVVLERTRVLKNLRGTLSNMKSMGFTGGVIDVDD